MSDKATMLRETAEAFADLRTMLAGLTEEADADIPASGLIRPTE